MQFRRQQKFGRRVAREHREQPGKLPGWGLSPPNNTMVLGTLEETHQMHAADYPARPHWTRVFKNLLANSFGQVVTIAIQLLAIPVYLAHWGDHLYGEWLLLSAVPMQLAISEIGFGSVSGNEMTMAVARGDFATAKSVYASAVLFVLCASSAVGLLFVSSLALHDWTPVLGVAQLRGEAALVISSALMAATVFTTALGVVGSGFRCNGGYPLFTSISNLGRLVEALGVVATVLLGYGPVIAALVIATLRLVQLVSAVAISWRRTPWLRTAHADRATIKRLLRPGSAFLGFPVGEALTNQGMVLAVGGVLGPQAVVVFSTTRTLTNSVQQTIRLLGLAVWVEMSAAYGAHKTDVVRALHRRAVQFSLWMALTASSILFLIGPELLRIWTRGMVAVDPLLLRILLVALVLRAVWYTSAILPMAISRHEKVALSYFVTTGSSVALAYLLLQSGHVAAVGFATLLGDLIMLPVVLPNSIRLTADQSVPFARSLLRGVQFRSLRGSLSGKPA